MGPANTIRPGELRPMASAQAGEAVMRAHHAAMAVRKFESALHRAAESFAQIHEEILEWQAGVFVGVIPFDEKDEADALEIYSIWLEHFDFVLATIKKLRDEYGSVEGAKEYLDTCEQAKIARATWRRPSIAKAVGSRILAIPAETAQEIKTLISKPLPEIPAVRSGVQIRDASFLTS